MQAPADFELELVLGQVELALSGASRAGTNRWLSTMAKFIVRVRAAALSLQQQTAQQAKQQESRRKQQQKQQQHNGRAESARQPVSQVLCCAMSW